MHTLLAFLIGALFAAGFYLLLRRSMMKIIIGLGLIGHAANLLIFTAGGLTPAIAPVIDADKEVLVGTFANPIPQALILTAIVIGFAVQAFMMVLIYRTIQATGTSDLELLTGNDSQGEAPTREHYEAPAVQPAAGGPTENVHH
jgi:multicomponent Na+:H+ antiporter subunit C